MLKKLLAGLAILKPGPNIVIQGPYVTVTYNQYVTSLDKAWLEANGWVYDHENGNWCFEHEFVFCNDAVEFGKRAEEIVDIFKTINLEF